MKVSEAQSSIASVASAVEAAGRDERGDLAAIAEAMSDEGTTEAADGKALGSTARPAARFNIGGDSDAEEIAGAVEERVRPSEVATCTAAKGPAWQAEQMATKAKRVAVGGSPAQAKRGRDADEVIDVEMPQSEATRDYFHPGTRVRFIGLQKVKFRNTDGKVIRGRDFGDEVGIVMRHLRERHAVQVVRETDEVMA